MHRRQFLGTVALGLGLGGCKLDPREGIWNSCRPPTLPAEMGDTGRMLIEQAWEGIDPTKVWDCHVHLAGLGDSQSGIWVNPRLKSAWRPAAWTRFRFFQNAVCTDDSATTVDEGVVRRLYSLASAMPKGFKLMLLAFDYAFNEHGVRLKSQSDFYIPNEYVAAVARWYPDRFEWIASIHPYRPDALERLAWAKAHGARAVKWLPAAMGMDPSSPRCDAFYEAMRQLDLPLLSHAGDEGAVHGAEKELLTNPLLLRRPLESGLKVIVAHCGTPGKSIDTDRNAPSYGEKMRNIVLFSRMMAERSHEDRLFGDISAILQGNRSREDQVALISNEAWHPRLIYGSDYPLTAVLPLISTRELVDRQILQSHEAQQLRKLRPHNPLLFDFVSKRLARASGVDFSRTVFETRNKFS